MTLFDYIKNGYTKLVVPSAMAGVPIEMPKLLREDGTYYSINDLHAEFGEFYSLKFKVTANHIMVRWAFDSWKEEMEFLQYMESTGMVNYGAPGVKVVDVDWSTLPANGFVVVKEHELGSVPQYVEIADVPENV